MKKKQEKNSILWFYFEILYQGEDNSLIGYITSSFKRKLSFCLYSVFEKS